MATTYLSRTLGTPTSAYKGTFSAWVKIGDINAHQALFSCGSDASNTNRFYITNGNKLEYYGQTGGVQNTYLQTSRNFYDPGGWYHIVLAWDTTQVTGTDRVRLYVNGVEYTWDAQTTQPTASDVLQTNLSGETLMIGATTVGPADYWTGLMSHVYFIDGLQYAASDFGETDATSGIWKPKSTASVTYGDNGGLYKFASGAFGADSSGESNTMAVSGTMTDTQDGPQNNFCTLSQLSRNYGTPPTIANGATTSTAGDNWISGTLAVKSGKWYWEVKVPSAGVECVTGVIRAPATNTASYSGNNWIGVGVDGVYAFAGLSGNKITSGTAASYDSALSTNDIMMFAMDATNGSLYTGVNGTWLQSSNPATSTSPMISSMGTATQDWWVPFTTLSSTGGACVNNFNFGNGYFASTVVSSAVADGDGEGQFEYTPPTGYYALCTNNLATYG